MLRATLMTEPPQTDVSRPSALPTANLRLTSTANKSIVDQNSAEYLDQIEEEWNKKVDVEVETLVDGMVDLVSLASASTTMTSMLSSECL
jgi:mediator of RNA polymerase II transcription subunit 22